MCYIKQFRLVHVWFLEQWEQALKELMQSLLLSLPVLGEG